MPVVIPELVYVVALFFALVGYLSARGMLSTWTHSIGYMLQWLGSFADIHVSSHGIGFTVPLGAVFRRADHYVVAALQTWADGAEIEMSYALHGLEKMFNYLAQATDFLARETAQTFDWLVDVHLPRWLKYAAAPLLLPWLIPKVLSAVLPHVGSKVFHTAKVIVHDVEHTITHTITRTVGAAAALPGWVIHIPRELTGIRSQLGRITRRLHRVEALLGATALAIAMANVLGVSARCLRSGNVGKMSRALCGLPSDIFGLLLGGLVVLEGGFSIVQFTKDLRSVETEIVAGLQATISELQGL